MKPFLKITVAALALASPAFAAPTAYDYEGFDTVDVDDGVSVTIIGGGAFSVSAEALRGNINRLEINQIGNLLQIGLADRAISLGFSPRIEVEITMPVIAALSAENGASLRAMGAAADLLGVNALSGASVRLTGIETVRVEIMADDGASLEFGGTVETIRAFADAGASLRLTGSCGQIWANSDNGSSLNARHMECSEGLLQALNGASLSGFASEMVDGIANSGASLVIYGAPERRVTGAEISASVSFR